VVEVALDEGVATIGLGRPEQMNALDFEAKNALLTALSRAGESDAVRAVLLTAEGRGFCVGQDLREFLAERDRVPTEQLFTTVRDHFNPLCELVASMNKPVVAAVQGAAAGAGLSLALAADFRVASATATFTTAFTGIALSPDTGMTWHLPRLVGSAKATELMMLSPTLSAEEALRIGLVTQVVAPDELATVARQMALRLAQGPTVAYDHVKRLVRLSASADLRESLDAEYLAVAECGASQDHEHAIRAFLDKRKPDFRGR
jgi:2-(1,2-epoxy-1,2-dihydrophenyl)acetyl-CoA isomerase